MKILFFGGDKGAAHVLRQVYKSCVLPGLVEPIDVFTWSPSRQGRGRRTIVTGDVELAARELGLNFFTADRPRHAGEYLMPEQIPQPHRYSLAVTVSFGSLIPSETLSCIKYGGLNVHPSLLPRYRGACPVQHAIMNNDTITGVTVQTLHPTKFDHGQIVAQSGRPHLLNPNISYPIVSVPPQSTFNSLYSTLIDQGARILCDTIEQLPKYDPDILEQGLVPNYEPSNARMIAGEQLHVNFCTEDALQIDRMARANSHPPYAELEDPDQGRIKVLLRNVQIVNNDEGIANMEPGAFTIDLNLNSMIIACSNGYVCADASKILRASPRLGKMAKDNGYGVAIGKLS